MCCGLQKNSDLVVRSSAKPKLRRGKRHNLWRRFLVSPQRGFTFIEILIALTVMGMLFVPVMQLFSHSVFATSESLDHIVALNLAKSEMEKTLNLNLTKIQLRELKDEFHPPQDQEPLVINHTRWRVRREIVEGSDPLEVRIRVYHEEDPDKDVVTLVTLIEDLMWEMVKPIAST